jgi:hypothetical protein
MSHSSASDAVRALSTLAALGFVACSLRAPSDDVLARDPSCPRSQKRCADDCVPVSPAVGCDGASCAPCALAHASPVCGLHGCAVGECVLGFADCDGIAENGCETNVGDDAENCGKCGARCSSERALTACVGGTCELAGCRPAFAECDGDPTTVCETDLHSDPAHCGSCSNACSLADATASCQNESCVVASCAPDHGDCNGIAQDGCETQLDSSAQHCGSCANACGSDLRCSDSLCVPRCHAMRVLQSDARIAVDPTGMSLGDADWTLEAWIRIRAPLRAGFVFRANEVYPLSGFDMSVASKGNVACTLTAPSVFPVVHSPQVTLDQWHHVACLRSGAVFSLYYDGVLADSTAAWGKLEMTSTLALGEPNGVPDPTLLAAVVDYGPLRFSSVARYTGSFAPKTHWPLDPDTVWQALTETSFIPDKAPSLIDEAGADNPGVHYGGFAPLETDLPCD